MVERTRALKRHHSDRIKAKRSSYVNTYVEATMTPQMPSDRSVGIVSCTPANCSCYMCGNPRKFFDEESLQEKSFVQLTKGVYEVF